MTPRVCFEARMDRQEIAPAVRPVMSRAHSSGRPGGPVHGRHRVSVFQTLGPCAAIVNRGLTSDSRPRLLTFGPSGLVAPRWRAGKVREKCFARKTGFYELCEATLHHGTPGV